MNMNSCRFILYLLLLRLFDVYIITYGASLVAQKVKKKKKRNLLAAMQETQVQSLGQEDPLEKGKTTHSSILV